MQLNSSQQKFLHSQNILLDDQDCYSVIYNSGEKIIFNKFFVILELGCCLCQNLRYPDCNQYSYRRVTKQRKAPSDHALDSSAGASQCQCPRTARLCLLNHWPDTCGTDVKNINFNIKNIGNVLRKICISYLSCSEKNAISLSKTEHTWRNEFLKQLKNQDTVCDRIKTPTYLSEDRKVLNNRHGKKYSMQFANINCSEFSTL